jgi:hypothetical protein
MYLRCFPEILFEKNVVVEAWIGVEEVGCFRFYSKLVRCPSRELPLRASSCSW